MARKTENRLPKKSEILPRTQNPYVLLTICGFLVLAVALSFAQSVGYDFVNYDDDMYVYENPQVTRGITAEGVAWAFAHTCAGNWHPLTCLSHMLDCQLYGVRHPGGHHLASLFLHAAAAIVLLLALVRISGRPLAQRVGGGDFRNPSPAGRIGRLGGRAKGCIERAAFYGDAVALRSLH